MVGFFFSYSVLFIYIGIYSLSTDTFPTEVWLSRLVFILNVSNCNGGDTPVRLWLTYSAISVQIPIRVAIFKDVSGQNTVTKDGLAVIKELNLLS